MKVKHGSLLEGQITTAPRNHPSSREKAEGRQAPTYAVHDTPTAGVTMFGEINVYFLITLRWNTHLNTHHELGRFGSCIVFIEGNVAWNPSCWQTHLPSLPSTAALRNVSALLDSEWSRDTETLVVELHRTSETLNSLSMTLQRPQLSLFWFSILFLMLMM